MFTGNIVQEKRWVIPSNGSTQNPGLSFFSGRSSGFSRVESNVVVSMQGVQLADMSTQQLTVFGNVTGNLVGNGSGITKNPMISNIQIANSSYVVQDDTAVSSENGGFVIINGTNFASGMSVDVGGTLASSVVLLSAVSIGAQLPAKSAGSYTVTVTRVDGKQGVLPLGITFSPFPVWSTTSTLFPTVNGMTFSTELANTLNSDSNITISTTSLPLGTTVTKSGSTVTFSGNITNVTNDTLYSFTLTATDAELQYISKTFSLQHIATYYSTLMGANILRFLQASRDSANISNVDGVLSTPAGTYPGSLSFFGGVLLPDGRVFCVPHYSTTARIYDPVTNTLSTPIGTYAGSAAFAGGVLLPDGRVFCVPCSSTSARIYDPVTNTLSTPTGAYPGTQAYIGGVLLQDGRVFCIPYNSTTARIYDPVTNTLSTPTGAYPGTQAYIGGVLLPDGRVFCVPCSSTSARIYDPVTDTLSTPTGAYPGSGAFIGGVLLPDGRVFCVPCSSTSARIYDPVTNTLSTPTGTYPGSAAFAGGVLLPDGRVFCIPHNSTSARVYDPVTNTLSTPTGTYPGSGAFYGSVLLPDGRAFCVPYNSTTSRIFAPSSTVSTPISTTIKLSPFLNKM